MNDNQHELDIDYASDLQLIKAISEDDSYWEGILDAKLDYLNNGIDPNSSPYVRPEIAQSWIRSKEAGLCPDSNNLGEFVSESMEQNIRRLNSHMTKETWRRLQSIDSLSLQKSYIFELLDKNGFSLIQFGNLKLHQFVGERYIVNEANTGTNAHALCMRHKKPFAIIGPEHYSFALHNLIACSAPISDRYGNTIGALLLTQPIADTFTSADKKLLVHAMSLISSMANSVSSQLRIDDSNSQPTEEQPKRTRTGRAPKRQASPKTQATGDSAKYTFDDILGDSPQIAKTKRLATRFAQNDENVLITGESGTGKELFAQAIHNMRSPDGPFISINCAAIPEQLIESELFGYEGGSFTGANKKGAPGKIELANGGTLFLDEIGDMPVELQSTLLRVLENKRVMRIGGTHYKQVSFRLISATNINLAQMAEQGNFREDLLYRLSVLTIQLPPLREREGDALLFATGFLEECRAKQHSPELSFSREAKKFIEGYFWPGNVRQLKHAVYSAFYTAESNIIKLDDFPSYITQELSERKYSSSPQHNSSSTVNVQTIDKYGIKLSAESEQSTSSLPTLLLSDLEKIAIAEALDLSSGDKQAASKLLGISRATLYRKLKE